MIEIMGGDGGGGTCWEDKERGGTFFAFILP